MAGLDGDGTSRPSSVSGDQRYDLGSDGISSDNRSLDTKAMVFLVHLHFWNTFYHLVLA